jgi:hypothetical protein
MNPILPLLPTRNADPALQGDSNKAVSRCEPPWEREIFFQPSLLEAERRRHPLPRRLGLLLALLLGVLGSGAAMAEEPAGEASTLEWLLQILGMGDEGEASTQDSGNDRDPDEGEP